MEVFYDIFKDLTFTKLKTVDGFAMYAALTQSFLVNGFYYVILLVPLNKAYHDTATIFQLDWSSLQTRVLQEKYSIQEQNLDTKIFDTRYAGKLPMKMISRTEKYTSYSPVHDIPVEVSLLHDSKRKTIYQYGDDMDLRHALKTFMCVVKRIRY